MQCLEKRIEMITGLPPYREPITEDVRCVCRAYYRVFTGNEDHQAKFAQKEALELGARFVDARVEPFVICSCGQTLDFAPEASLMIQ
jgi:hypothetical protein